MRKSRVIGFNPTKMKQNMMAIAINEQNTRLVEYAIDATLKIGADIMFSTPHDFEDKGNLLDSICWCVSYSGKKVDSGFLREAVASEPSYLHEWSQATFKDTRRGTRFGKWETASAAEDVYGRRLARNYLAKIANKSNQGQWVVTFAILAPYWGYWEKGFTMVGKNHRTKIEGVMILTQNYDKIKRDLKPARTRINIHIEKYASKSLRSAARRNFYTP